MTTESGIDEQPEMITAHSKIISDSALMSAQAVLKRRALLDDQGLHDTPLVIILGEEHSRSANFIHHMLLIDELAKSEPIAVSNEHAHNILDSAYHNFVGDHADSSVLVTLKEQDKDGALSLKIWNGFRATGYAPQSRIAFYDFLLERAIPARFTDAPKPDFILDHTDPTTALSMKKCLGEIRADIHAGSPEGMYIRNHHMAALTKDFAKQQGVRIVVQICGNLHVGGDLDEKLSGTHSLAGQFREASLPFIMMPVKTASTVVGSLPQDFSIKAGEMHYINQLPEISAIYDQETNAPIPQLPADLTNRQSEIAYVYPILQTVGQPVLSLQEREERSARHRQEILDLFKGPSR